MPSLTPKPASESEAILTHIVRAEDINMHGSLFGGKMMAFMDTCAAIAAMRHCARNCVTVHVSDISFIAPVRVGHILTLRARLHFTSRTSMEVGVMAWREDHISGDIVKVCEATFTFVAVDGDHKPVPVPPVVLETDEDRSLEAEAKRRYEERRMTGHLQR